MNKDKAMSLIQEEKARIEASDYHIEKNLIYWTDSFSKTIKRSYIPHEDANDIRTGHAQDLHLKGNFNKCKLSL